MILRRAAAVLTVAFCLLASSAAAAYSFIEGCGPSWSELPVTYEVLPAGTDQFDEFSIMEAMIDAAFDAWTEPCCSTFDARPAVAGETPTAEITFHDAHWPAVYGGPDTIAVTLTSVDSDCAIEQAPIHINSEHHRFVDGSEEPGQGLDLQSIAAHEVGHLAGLGHSPQIEATMYAHYVGGTSPRDLHPGDISGICALYPQACSCEHTTDCPPGQICLDEICQQEGCTGDDHCLAPQRCDGGLCQYTACTTSEECPDDLICEDNRCQSACPTCRPCSSHDECGQRGFCRPFQDHGRCMLLCGLDGHCPGDSECAAFSLGDAGYSLCAAPDAESIDQACPEDYLCRDDGEHFEPCPGLGANCDRDDFGCSPVNDLCLDDDRGGLVCSCTCTSDADCGPGNPCVDQGGGRFACEPGEAVICDGPSCPERPPEATGSRCHAIPGGPSPLGPWAILIAISVMLLLRRGGPAPEL